MWKLTMAAAALIAAVMIPSAVVANDPFRGEIIYRQNCIGCHGADGRPSIAGTPSFVRGERLNQPDTTLLVTLKQGKNLCPSWHRIIADQDLLNVITYVRTLQK